MIVYLPALTNKKSLSVTFRYLCYNRVSICTVVLNTQVEPVAFSSFVSAGHYSCPAMFSLKTQQKAIISICMQEPKTAVKLFYLRRQETNPELSPGVPDNPVLGAVLRHAPAGHRDDVVGQRQRVKL